jgi:hypothetical protein
MPSYSYISQKLRHKTAQKYKEAFSSLEAPFISYIFIGDHMPWANDSIANTIIDTVATEKSLWNNMIAAKKITGNDVQLVTERVDWVANTVYQQYDDTIELDDLLYANNTTGREAMYAMNSEGNVYKCLFNNNNSPSTIEPLGQNLNNAGNILTADKYLWKYMYNVLANNKFLSNTWIPIPIMVSTVEYGASALTTIDGELTTIAMKNVGSGYINSTIKVSAFAAACTILTVDSSVDVSNLIFANMAISGTGIVGGTYVTSVDPVLRKIGLVYPTTASGGGTANANNLTVSTRVVVQGDGEGALATANVVNTTINKITVTNFGLGYTYANVYIYGTATGANKANARIILPPKFGHGYNAAEEMGGHNVMITTKIGDVDTTEGGIISANTSFRQYGLLKNPYKYGATEELTYANANSVISQTTDISLIAGSAYTLNEFVYQGPLSNPTFSGYVNTQEPLTIKITNVRGTIGIGSVLKGTLSNLTGRTVFDIKYPEFQPFTGDIEYAENFAPIERQNGQAENIKFIIKF